MTGAMFPRPRFVCVCGREVSTTSMFPDDSGQFLLRWHRHPISGLGCGNGYRRVEAKSDRRVTP